MSLYQIFISICKFRNFMLLVFGLTQICCVRSMLPFSRTCPTNVTAMDDFDVKKFLGLWFIYSRFPFLEEPGKGICETVDYIGIDDENYVIHKSDVDGISEKRRRTVIPINKVTRNGRFTQVKANNVFPLGIDIWVLDTDYDNYAVRYLCINVLGAMHYQWAAIYTREHLPSAQIIKWAEDVIKKQEIDLTKLQIVDNTACPVA